MLLLIIVEKRRAVSTIRVPYQDSKKRRLTFIIIQCPQLRKRNETFSYRDANIITLHSHCMEFYFADLSNDSLTINRFDAQMQARVKTKKQAFLKFNPFLIKINHTPP